MTPTVEIDPNVRTPNGTFAGLEDVRNGPVEVGQVVHVVEPESGLFGGALVTSIDEDRQLVYLSVAWNTLSPAWTPHVELDALVQEAAELGLYESTAEPRDTR